MLISYFYHLRRCGVPVTIRELLDLLAGLKAQVAFADKEQFYYYSRCCLIKDEKHFDRFDRAFDAFFKGIDSIDGLLEAVIPDEWLREQFMRSLSDEEKAQIETLGGLEELLDAFKERLQEQENRHEGGNRWIGTGGTSPFGHSGYNPEGIRVGGEGKHGKAVKVWEQRQYKNFDENNEISARNIQVALRRLRKFARSGADDQFDLDGTISSTAKNAGLLDIRMVPERRNQVKVLMFFDIGGSMDAHIESCQRLFDAVRTEFKHLEYFYFHNCIYESVWKDNSRRNQERMDIYDVMNRYGRDYKVIFVGDATMSPYEILQPGGSVEHWNQEAGQVWLERMLNTYDRVAWLNPVPPEAWEYTHSVQILRQIMQGHMYPLTVAGLEEGMTYLSK